MITRLLLPLAASLGISATVAAQGTIPTPRDATGLDVGADRVLADWGQITSYLATLAKTSPSVRLDTLGPTTEGRPLVMATITSAENMRRIGEIRALQQRLADPRRLDAAGEAQAVAEQPAVVVISCNIHASEIGSSQMAMELAWRLATNDTLQGYLRNVVVLLIPSMNPDGQQMVTDWYRRGVGTKWEGGPLPWLYHHYVGHDNNRDWYMVTQAETQAVSRMLYQQWFPEVFYDVHQQGSYGMRITVPPHIDPIDPYVDPLIVRGINQIGAQMSWALESRGKTGVGDRATYDLWWHGGARSAPTRHNMIGLLTEAASARVATPITIPVDSLRGHDRGLPRYERRVNFPNPWPGGTWRLRDIMDYELIAAEAVVKLASDQRGEYVRNFVALGRKAVAAGAAGGGTPYAYRVSAGRDPEASARLLEALRWGGVEMGTVAGSADVIIPLAQPYRAHVMDLFEVQRYPKMERYPGGPVEPPYDVTGWTLPLQMGVSVATIDTALRAPLTPMTSMTPAFPTTSCTPTGNGRYVVLDASDTRSYGLVAQALRAGHEVRASGSGATARFTTAGPVATTRGCAPRRTGAMPSGARLTRLPRIALYRSWTASMDEGWTRFLLEQERIPFASLGDSAVKAGKLRDLYDVILVPDMSFREIHDGMSASQVPPQYAGGLGDRGVAELAAFVRDGGTLVLLDRASELATTALGVPVRRITVPRQDDEGAQGGGGSLYAPGSILRVLVDGSSHVARGMSDTAAVYFTNSVTFDVPAGTTARVIARYPARESDILLSGYLQGGAAIAGKAAAVDVPVGRGRVVMFGFRAQYRGQSYGTFKLLFNALLGEGDSATRR